MKSDAVRSLRLRIQYVLPGFKPAVCSQKRNISIHKISPLYEVSDFVRNMFFQVSNLLYANKKETFLPQDTPMEQKCRIYHYTKSPTPYPYMLTKRRTRFTTTKNIYYLTQLVNQITIHFLIPGCSNDKHP
jgi:hypothetical protein